MSRDRASQTDAPRPPCSRRDCDTAADFRLYHPEDGWRPICERHAVSLHPSLEVHAWLESGYLRPIELAVPEGPPAEPADERTAAFRELVEEAIGWTG